MKRSKTSRQWMKEHVSDVYVQRAKAQGYRSRAAFKLTEIDDKHRILKAGAKVVDLGAAPGGWSQIAAKRGRKTGSDVPDHQWTMVTLDDGTTVTVGAGQFQVTDVDNTPGQLTYTIATAPLHGRLEYRIDGSTWQPLPDGEVIPDAAFVGDGRKQLEVRAAGPDGVCRLMTATNTRGSTVP